MIDAVAWLPEIAYKRIRKEQAAVPEYPISFLEQYSDLVRYLVDSSQRWILFLDAMRKRADIMLDHMAEGMPPLLAFDHEVILDGRRFPRPANYALLRIVPPPDAKIDESKPPVVIFDPRAGHGPGIGCFKSDSEAGMAMAEGHQPYFVSFFPEPCPGQTIEDVELAQVRFLEEVHRRHERAGRPIVYGNCQAGWAVAMLGADRPDVTGPIVVNGAPMSYWAGEAGENPLRVSGNLLGGDWTIRLLSDLGGGLFDGAWLVWNFEKLNPANTLWNKKYNLWKNIDTEEERFLDFERWWTGFYFMAKAEILWIVQNLFIGNLLEQGKLKLGPGHEIDMRNLRDPLVIFASNGDNITPPYQALDWISEIYADTAELERNGQRIVYMINPHVGHLGIFVSAKVARREHRAIMESIDAVRSLEPGLYEMFIDGETGETDPVKKQFEVRFEKRRVEDVAFPTNRDVFGKVTRTSKAAGELYELWWGPLVRALAVPPLVEILRWMHPDRASRLVFSGRVLPAMELLRSLASAVREHRMPAGRDNPFTGLERLTSRTVTAWLDLYRDARDEYLGMLFRRMYV